ncbi:hypothetical protein H2203_003554 [Taxawa tesnikishii (nom. ined.)]|nr:hypothetical protein H2203_003554 [Dothideales sp. JES 119]
MVAFCPALLLSCCGGEPRFRGLLFPALNSVRSLPGALGMYGLSLGIERAESALPAPAYALLSGLNAATVGIIALAAVQLAEKAITDRREDTHPREHADVDLEGSDAIEMRTKVPSAGEAVQSGSDIQGRRSANNSNVTLPTAEAELREESDARVVPSSLEIKVCTWKGGIAIITCFLVSFIAVVVLRGVLFSPPRGFSLLANLYLAGTIIFGGGPVVVPLLREYVVAEGWVSPRNFLLGLAVIQAFPGPNFNFAVYLGSLATVGTPLPSAVGALIGYLAIFIPGLAIVSGTMGVWKELRSRRWLTSLLRGVNAMAVGLVYTAVFRLWQIGFIDAEHENGSPLGSDPWFVAVTATSFVTQRWFGLNAPLAILLGGAMGVIWYGVTQT